MLWMSVQTIRKVLLSLHEEDIKEIREMNKYEKDILRLLEAHTRIDKSDLIRNINNALSSRGIHWKGKNQWVCNVTGSPMGTVATWFSHSKCRALNKIPLDAMCQMAIALKMPVWEFLNAAEKEQETDEPEIDRRSSLYWYIRRKEAEDIWNSSHAQEKGTWSEQDKAIQREFLDMLYLERMELYERGYQNEKNMEEEQNG